MSQRMNAMPGCARHGRSPNARGVRFVRDRVHGYDVTVSSLLSSFATRLGRSSGLDPVATPLGDAVKLAVPPGGVKDTLSGVWLGHPLHPMLTDLPIGFWTSAFMLDLVGGRRSRRARRRCSSGWASSAPSPAMAAGASDWGDTTGPRAPRRARPRGSQHRRGRVLRSVLVEPAPRPPSPRGRLRTRRRDRRDGRRVPRRAPAAGARCRDRQHRLRDSARRVDLRPGERGRHRATAVRRRRRCPGRRRPERGTGRRGRRALPAPGRTHGRGDHRG